MTCIVGLTENGITWMGGDSLGSNGYAKVHRKDKKVFKPINTKHSIMGYTTSFRMGQLMMYNNLVDERYTINHKYMVKKFIPKLTDVFNNGGFLSQNDSGRLLGGEFIFAHRDKLFRIYSDFQVEELFDNYISCGSGESFALGSLKTTEDMNMKPVDRIHKALQAASKFNVGVAPPFYIINTENDEIIEFKE